MIKTLLTCDVNYNYKIQDVIETDKKLKIRYAELGILSGQNIVVINKNKYNVLISVRNAVFAIDKNLAGKVIVYA